MVILVVDILKNAAFVAALIAETRRLGLMGAAPTRDSHKSVRLTKVIMEAEAKGPLERV